MRKDSEARGTKRKFEEDEMKVGKEPGWYGGDTRGSHPREKQDLQFQEF